MHVVDISHPIGAEGENATDANGPGSVISKRTLYLVAVFWLILTIILLIVRPGIGIPFIFLPLVTLLFKAILWYIHGIAVKPLITPRHSLTLGGVKMDMLSLAYGLVFFLSILSGTGARVCPRGKNPNIFMTLFYNMFGAWMMVLVACYAVDVVFRVAEFGGRKVDKRQKAVASLIVIVIVFVQSGILAYGTPTITHVSIPVPNLDPCISGYKICVLSDVHIGPLVSTFDSTRALGACSEENADSVALVGDLGDHKYDEDGYTDLGMTPYGEWLSGDGAGKELIWTSGNHENIVGVEDWRSAIAKYGIRNVENKHFVHTVDDNGGCKGNVSFVGISDEGGTRMKNQGVYPDGILLPDIEGTMENLRNSSGVSGPTVLLSHTPSNFQKNVNEGVDVMLSGHTHGGHIFPFHFFMFSFDGASGLFEKEREGGGRGFLYVSEGVVGWGPRVRLFSRPEIAIVELVVDEGQEPTGNTGMTMGQFFSWFSYFSVPLAMLSCLVVNIRDWRKRKAG